MHGQQTDTLLYNVSQTDCSLKYYVVFTLLNFYNNQVLCTPLVMEPRFDMFGWYFVRLNCITVRRNLQGSSNFNDLINLVALLFL